MKKLKLTFRAETLRTLTSSQLADIGGGGINRADTDQVVVLESNPCEMACPGPSKNTPTEYIKNIWVC